MLQNIPQKHDFNDHVIVHHLNMFILSSTVNHPSIFGQLGAVCVCVYVGYSKEL